MSVIGGEDLFPSITTTGTVAAAYSFAPIVQNVVLLVIGLGLVFAVGSWVISKTVNR